MKVHWSRAFHIIANYANVSSDVEKLRASRPTELQLSLVRRSLEGKRSEFNEDPDEVISAVKRYFDESNSVWAPKESRERHSNSASSDRVTNESNQCT